MIGLSFRKKLSPTKWHTAVSSLLLIASIFLTPTAGADEVASYTIEALGTLGGNTSSALDVNNHRQVTGNSLVTSDPGSTGSLLRAYLWTSGAMTNLGSMGPVPPSTSTNRFARGYAVNDSGVVVGEFNNDSSRAFVYRGGVMSGLTRLAGGTDNGVAVDINNSNVIVGSSSSNGTATRPTKWTFDGTYYVPSDLGTIGGTPTSSGRATAINVNGSVAGQSTNSTGTTQATPLAWRHYHQPDLARRRHTIQPGIWAQRSAGSGRFLVHRADRRRTDRNHQHDRHHPGFPLA